MKDLQKKLMNANPKSTFGVVLCCFAASMALLAWVLIPTASGTATPAIPAGDESKPPLPDSIPTSTALLGILRAQLDNNDVPPFNPFAPSLDIVNAASRGDRLAERRDRRNDGWNSTVNNTNNKPNNGTTTFQTNNPNNPRPVPKTTLSYKGYMTRVDGVPLAFIQNSATKKTQFHAAHQAAPANETTLLDVTHESITVRLPDGTEKMIRLGESLEF